MPILIADFPHHDLQQSLNNAHVAANAGLKGVMLHETVGNRDDLLAAAGAIKTSHSSLFVGIAVPAGAGSGVLIRAATHGIHGVWYESGQSVFGPAIFNEGDQTCLIFADALIPGSHSRTMMAAEYGVIPVARCTDPAATPTSSNLSSLKMAIDGKTTAAAGAFTAANLLTFGSGADFFFVSAPEASNALALDGAKLRSLSSLIS